MHVLRRGRLPINQLLASLFLLFALPTLSFIAFATPPGESPDEAAHLARAGSLLHGQLLGSRRPVLYWAGQRIVNAGVKSNTGPNAVAYGFGYAPGSGEKMTLALHDKLASIPWSKHTEFIFVPNTASYFPIFYLPASVGLGLSQLLGASPLTAVLAARVAGGLTYLALGVLALFLARRGHVLLFAALSLPMSLWLGATCTQDGVMLAALCLGCALLTRAERPHGKAYWVAGVLLACVIAVKAVYLGFAFAMLLPWPVGERSQALPAFAGVLLAAVPALVWTAVAQAVASAVFFLQPPYHPGPLWPGDPTSFFISPSPRAQAEVFLHDPSLLLTLPFWTLLQAGWWRINEMIGVLGSLDLVLPRPVYAVWQVALGSSVLASLLRQRGGCKPPHPLPVTLLLAALVMTIFVLYDAAYLLWTNVGQEMIEGVQGRYFLPLLPILAIALPSVRLRHAGLAQGALALPPVCLACAGMAALPLFLVDRYYLP